MEEFKIALGVELKAGAEESIKQQVNNIKTNPIKLNIDTSNVTSQLNSIKKQIQNLSNIKITLSGNSGSGTSNGIQKTVTDMNYAYKQILNIQKNIGSLKIKIGSLDGVKNSKEIAELSTQLKALEADYRTIQSTFNQNLSVDQWGKLQAVIDNTENKLSQLAAKAQDVKQKLANGIQAKIDNGTINNQISTIENRMKSLGLSNDEVRTKIESLKTSMTSMTNSTNMEHLIGEYRNYQQTLTDVTNQVNILARQQKLANDAAKLNAGRTALSSQMDVWLKNNSAAASKFGSQIRLLQAELKSCDATRLAGIRTEFQEVARQAQLAGKATLSFGDSLKRQMGKLTTYFSATMMITQTIQGLRSMYNNVLEVDTAMTGLYRVTNLTSQQYSTLYDKMVSSAKEYGAALSDIVESTASWVRLGFDANNAERLSEITTMYQHVTDLDNTTAVNNLVTAYKGFQDQLLELTNGDEAAAIELVADIYDKLGNEFAVSAADVGTGLAKTASALQLAGNTIQESAAMLTGITEVTQDPDKAGNSLKVLSLRIRGMKGELQKLGEDVDENVESLSKMQTQVLNLTHGKVNIFNDDGSFKSTYEIMKDIAKIYDDLTDTDKADLLETIAGKNRANDVAALISNWEQVEKAMTAATNAEGTAAAENEKYMNSLKGHLDSLTAAWQALSNSFLDSGFLKGLISGLTQLISFLDVMVDKFGVLPTLFTGIAAALSFKNIGIFKTIEDDATVSGLRITSIFQDAFAAIRSASTGITFSPEFEASVQADVVALQNFQAAVQSGMSTEEAFAATMSMASTEAQQYAQQMGAAGISTKQFETNQKLAQVSLTAQNKSLVSAKSLITEYNKGCANVGVSQSQFISAVSKSNSGLSKYLSGLNGAKGSLGGYVVSLIGAKAATIGLQIATTALNMTITMGLSLIITALVTAISNWINAEKEAREAALETGKAAQDEAKKIRELYNTYNQTNSAYKNNAASKSELEGATDSLLSALGVEQSELEELIKKYGSLDDAIKSVTTKSLKEQLSDLTSGYEAAKEDLLDTTKDGWFSSFSLIDFSHDEDTKKFAEVLKDAGLISSGSYGSAGGSIYIGENETVEGVIEMYDNLQKMKETLDSKVGELYTREELSESDLWKELNGKIGEFEEQYKTLDSYITDINKTAGQLEYDEYIDANGVPQTREQYEALRDTLIKTAESSGNFVGSQEQIKNSIVDLLSEIPELSSVIDNYNNSLGSVEETKNKISFGELVADEGFVKQVDNYIDRVGKLQTAMRNFQNGKLTSNDFIELVKEFPELADNADDLDSAISELLSTMNTDITSEFANQFGNLDTDEDIKALENFEDAVLELGKVVGNTEFSIDIETETEGMQNLFTAMKESVTSTGLTSQSISNLKARYQDLENYDASRLFERTTNGIHLNTKALRELESEYEKQRKSEIDGHLEDLVDEYNNLTEKINKASDAASTADLYAQRADILDQINDTADLAAQYEGLTSAFYKWEEAQSIGEEGDMYDSLAGSLKNIKELYDEGLIGTNKFRTAVQLMSNEDLSTANVDELLSAYESSYSTMKKYFQEGSDGCLNFLTDIQSLNSEWAKMNQDGSWEINFGLGNDQEIADALGINVESVQAIMRKLSDYGFDINLDSVYSSFDLLKSKAEEANDKLKELSKTEYTFNFETSDIDYVNEQIKEAQGLLDTFKNTDGTVNVKAEGYEEAQTILTSLISSKQSLSAPEVMSIDTTALSEADSEISNAISSLQEFVKYSNDLEIEAALGIDTSDTQQKIQNVANDLSGIPEEVKTKLGLDDESFQTAISNIQGTEIDVKAGVTLKDGDIESVQTTIDGIKAKDIELLSNSDAINKELEGINKYEISDKKFTVSISNDPVSVLNNINSYVIKDKTYTITAKTVNTGTGKAQGTAYARGNWGTKESGVALGGELGQELVVRDGRFFTIGDESAEFFKYQKGDIIFNHKQTEEIFANGKILNGSKRGKTFASGTAFSNGSGKITVKGKTKTTPTNDDKDKKKKDKKEKTALEKFQEWIDKLFDWIEIKLQRQSEKIDRYINKAENARDAGKYDTSAKNYRNAINATSTQISYEQQASSKYQTQANKVLNKAVKMGVVSQKQADSIKKKVANGSMNIKEYSKEMQEVIKDYQEWYEKSIKAKDAIAELHNNIRQYIKDLKDMRDAQRDVRLDKIDTYSSIGTSGYAFTYQTQNSQLNFSNKQLTKQNEAYDKEVTDVSKDINKIGKSGTTAINKALKTKDAKGKSKKNKAYKKALNNAKKAINAKKAVASADMKVIKSHSISVYEKLYAYNQSLENLEIAKLEQATNFAATSAERFENMAQKYENKDSKTNDKISLLRLKSQNATSAKSKNSNLDKAASQYDQIIADDKAEIADYTNETNSNAKVIKNKAGTGSKYKNLSKKSQKNVMSIINKAKNAAKGGKTIDASTISKLAEYYSKGYVSKAFYEACINYNNAIQHRKEAEAQLEIDEQTAIQEKAAIGAEKFSNVEQEYTNKQNENKSNKNKEAIRQSIKSTKGMTLTASDYQTMLNYSKKEQQIYTDEITALNQTIQQNLSSGYWTTTSQEYIDAMNSVRGYEEEVLNCQQEQEELNNEIAQLPYTMFDKAISLIKSIKSNFQSLLSIRTTRGIAKTNNDILSEIGYTNTEISRLIEKRSQLWSDYQKALYSSDGVYGGKDADTWLQEYYDTDTEINNLRADVESLNNEIAQLPYDVYERALDLLDAMAKHNKSISDLTKAQGRDLTENDYFTQIKDNDNMIAQYEGERIQAYSDYLKALSNADGVYGGMTSSEWLARYYELGTTINDLKADNEDIRDALRDDVYWRTYERTHKAAKALADVLSGISDLIDDDMLYNKDGQFTEFGVAQMANMVKQYENARKEVGNYTNDIQNLNKLYAQGFYNQDEFNEKLNELQEGLFDAASSMKSYISEIIEMNKNLAQSELDSLFKLIDARNDALSAKKSYYDYDKTIKSKTKDIQALQAQIAALEGVETAEAKAQKARLEADLSTAKDDLNDTIVNHSFELSQDALDELKTILQDEFDDRWDNIGQDLNEVQKLLQAANDLSAAQSATVGNAMNKLLAFYGINPVSTDLNQYIGYASGTRNVDKNRLAWTQENGQEFIVRKSDGAILTPLNQGDAVISNDLSNNLFAWGKENPQEFVNSLLGKMPDIPNAHSSTPSIEQHYDSLLNVEGNVDSTVITDLQKFAKAFYQGSYEYTVNEIAKDARRKGIKT